MHKQREERNRRQLESSKILMLFPLAVIASGHAQGAQGFAPLLREAGKEGRQERGASTRPKAITRAAERDRAASRPQTMGQQEILAALMHYAHHLLVGRQLTTHKWLVVIVRCVIVSSAGYI
jgi:hypothetical protein